MQEMVFVKNPYGLPVVFLLFLAISVSGCGFEKKRARNVVLISIDTLNRSALKIFNSKAPELPNLDRFSHRALSFTNAYATSPWTLPSHASLLTGLYPDRHGAIDPRRKISERAPILVSLFQQAGFETVSFNDGGYLHHEFGFSVGFDLYNGFNITKQLKLKKIPREGKPNSSRGSALFDRAISYLLQRKIEDPPFFLFLQTYSVHDYFKLHPWSVKYIGNPAIHDEDYYLGCLLGLRVCSDQDWTTLKALYQAELYNLDEGFRHLMTVLKKQGLEDSTLIVFVSDHGEGFDAQRGRIHHGGRLHEDMIRIPLLIAGPGIEPRVADDPISLVDIMPTVLDLLGVTVPSGLDGLSFAKMVHDGKKLEPRPLFAMEFFHRWINGRRVNSSKIRKDPISLAVIKEDFWYIKEPSGEEVYNMAVDAEQTQNLSAKSPMLRELRETVSARKLSRLSIKTRNKNELLEKQLQSLGYLQ